MYNRPTCAMILARLVTWTSPVRGQAAKPVAPATMAAVGPLDAEIVRRAESLLSSPQHWNRVDRGSCPRADTTYSVRCALRRAVVEAAGLVWNSGAVAARSQPSAARVECSMDISADHPGGSCGTLWDEVPVFTLSHAKAITTGVWRKDAQPTEVWAGTMADAEGPVNYESRHGAEVLTRRTSSDARIDFNNETSRYPGRGREQHQCAGRRDAPVPSQSLQHDGAAQVFGGGHRMPRSQRVITRALGSHVV